MREGVVKLLASDLLRDLSAETHRPETDLADANVRGGESGELHIENEYRRNLQGAE
jgi:hypothetical protein